MLGVVGFGQQSNTLGNIFDKDGKKYNLDDISIIPQNKNAKNIVSNTTLLCSSGIFDLYFETGSGMENTNNATQNARRAVVCQVFQDLSNFINSPLKNVGNTTRVKIWVRDIKQIIPVPNGIGGLATSFFNLPNNTNVTFGGIADNEIWKTIQSGKDSYTNTAAPVIATNNVAVNSGLYYHGLVALNFETLIASPINWNLNLNANASSTQIDLYTLTLHEVCHALGLASLIDQNGNSRFGNGFNYFSRYDRFLKNNNGSQFLINNLGACNSMYNYKFNTAINPSVLYPNCTTPNHLAVNFTNQTACNSANMFYGTSVIPVYTPTCFEPGSSLSHFEDQCVSPFVNDAYYVMSNLIDNGNTKRFLKQEERNALSDIGYSVNSTYGNNNIVLNSFKDYLAPTSAGISVAGINDGIDNLGYYTYAGTTGSNIQITGILNNDFTTNITDLRFECLQDVYDPSAVLSATSGGSSTIVNFNSSVTGLHLLRYVPYNNSTQQRGNITYVYVYIISLNNCATPNACNIVSNGDFEQKSSLPTNQGQVSYACNWNAVSSTSSTDYFHFDSLIQNYKTPCNFMGRETDKKGLKAYIGMYAIKKVLGTNPYYESVRTKLSSPLLPNTNYQLSFDVSLAEASSFSSIKFQAYFSPTLYVGSVTIGNTTLPLFNDIPITNPAMLFTNPNFSTTTNGWERITFKFTTGSVAGETYLYLGGLNNVQFSAPLSPAFTPGCNYSYVSAVQDEPSYYYVDNVELVPLNGASFNLPTEICINNSIPNLKNYLSLVNINGIFTGNGVVNTGGVFSFNPAVAGVGTQTITYTFTNNLGCAIPISSSITVVTSNIVPVFNPITPICSGTSFTLPTTSTNANGITGTWTPAINNNATTTYTFTPNANNCANTTTLTITILPANNPACNSNSCVPNLTLSSPETNTSIIYKRLNWIESNSTYATSSGQDVKMKAGDFICLKPNTYIRGGSFYQAKIEQCTSTSKLAPELNKTVENIINIFPNPTNGMATITTLNTSIKMISVVAIDGKMVYVDNNLNRADYQLDMTIYENGIYLIAIETTDGQTYFKKLIKD
jgi:hypothetical protein